MKKRTERNSGFFGMGVSLMLTVFLVVMLVTFSLMSLSTARSDLNRSQLLAQRRTEFYEASNQAEMILHQLNLGQVPEHPVVIDGENAYFEVSATNDAVLCVNLQLHDGIYHILQWEMKTN